MNYKWLIPIAFVMLLVCPAMAGQSATGIIVDSKNVVQDITNIDRVGNVNLDPTFNTANTDSRTYYNIDTAPEFYGLETGTVSYTRLIYPNEIVSFPVKLNESYSIITSVPMAVYTVDGYGLSHLKGSQSMLIYDPIYNRFDHGTVTPIDVVPYYTTKAGLRVTAGATHMVVDNRYFPAMAMIEVISY